MTEEIAVEAVETETESDAPDTQQAQKGKVFTQEDVNKLIAKEKAAWKRTHDKVSAEDETIVEGLRGDVERRNEIIQKQIAILERDLGLDAETKELLEGLDTIARYEWVLKKVEKLGKKEIPRTPSGEGERSNSVVFEHKISRI
jgi:hypothetical protein